MEDLGLFREELTLYVHVNSCRTSAVAGKGDRGGQVTDM